jgi:chloride channel protein, CIC family
MMLHWNVLRIYGVSILLGVLTGAVGSLFQLSIEWTDKGMSHLFALSTSSHLPTWLISMVVSMVMVLASSYLVFRFAPEASGSGVQEIEGALLAKRRIDWRHLLPVKFLAGVLAISAKMVMGREGPTIQMGGNLGEMIGEKLRFGREDRNTLIGAGAAAGLATAFNAPLAGVVFILEEMREQFNFSFTNFKAVAICCVMATVTLHQIIGDFPAINMKLFTPPGLHLLWLFFIFGLVIGFIGLWFNIALMKTLDLVENFKVKHRVIFVMCIGLLVGFLAIAFPETVGGGYSIIHEALTMTSSVKILLLIFAARFFTTMLSYSSSVPGGIFAPMLALGTLLGISFCGICNLFVPYELEAGMFAVAGMGALFAASVRAPITGIILIVEMTQNYLLILPLMVTCLTSTTVVQIAENRPIYAQLLARVLEKNQ